MLQLLSRLLPSGRRRHAGLLLLAVAVLVVAGGALFALTQHLPFTTGLYWAVTTATTVGYGDVTPKNPAGRLIASVVMLTCIPLLGAAFALFTSDRVADGIRKVLNMRSFPAGSYRLVLGSHAAVPAIVDELARADDAVVLVADVEPGKVRDDVHLVRGDPTDPAVLRRARPEGAVHALVTGSAEGDVLVSTVMLRRAAPDLAISALVETAPVREALRELGVGEVVSANELVAHMMAKSLEAPHAGDLLLRLIDSEDHRLVEVDLEGDHVGKRLSEVRDERDDLVLGVVRSGNRRRDSGGAASVTVGVGEDPVVEAGDRLLVVVSTRGGRRDGAPAGRR